MFWKKKVTVDNNGSFTCWWHVFRCLTLGMLLGAWHAFIHLILSQLHPPSNLDFSPQNWVDNSNLNIQYIISVIIQNFAMGLISYLGYAPYNFHPFFLSISLYYLILLAIKFLCSHRQCHSTIFTSFWRLAHHSRQCGCYHVSSSQNYQMGCLRESLF